MASSSTSAAAASSSSSSWVRSITTPFRKARTLFNPKDNRSQQQQQQQQQEDDDHSGSIDLQGEVMACAYEDVQVMWSMLDNSKQKLCKIPS